MTSIAIPQMTPEGLELLLNGAIPLITVAAGWFVGKRILVAWDIRKKRQELDIAAAETFQQLYGELKEVARLWKAVVQREHGAIHPPASVQWDLFARAASAESKYEALVIKLATERRLALEDVQALGVFRQACQDVRDSIKNGKVVPASVFGGRYIAFNDLAAAVTVLVGSNTKRVVLDRESAKKNLHDILSIGHATWEEMGRRYDETVVPLIRVDKG